MMNIYATYAFALTLSSTIAFLLVPCNSAQLGKNYNVRSFTKHAETVLVGVRGPLIDDEAKIFTEAWKMAFNALHTNHTVNTVVVTQDRNNVGLASKTKSRGHLRASSTLSTHVALQFNLLCHCHHCNSQDALLANFQTFPTLSVSGRVLLKTFQVDLCDSLRRSSKPIFANVSECIVSFQSLDESSLLVMHRSGVPNEGETVEIREQVLTILYGVDHDLSEYDTNVLNDIWMRTYNNMHDGVAQVQSVSAVGEERQKASNGFSFESWASDSSTSVWMAIRGRCVGCSRDATLADDIFPSHSPLLQGLLRGAADPTLIHREFERALCKNLRASNTTTFNVIDKCIIEFHPTTSGPAIQRAQNIEVVLMGSPGLMNDDESVFMNECIKMSYNSLHDTIDIDLQQVALESQVHHQPVEKSLQNDNLGYTDFWFYVSGRCRMCNPGDIDPSFLPPLSLVASHSGVDPIVLHRGFEMILCGALRAGPYEYFHDIGDCIVSFTATPKVIIPSS